MNDRYAQLRSFYANISHKKDEALRVGWRCVDDQILRLEVLLEGMYKGWASPKVVRDIMDHISTSAKTMNRGGNGLPYGLGSVNSDLEDKILLTSLLKNLDKPASEWTEPTHLFLLLALVTRARENKMNRAEP